MPDAARRHLIEQLADAMPHMVWITLPDGYHEYYNRRWYEFTGVPQGSTDGEAWNGMFHPDDRARAWERWRHSLTTGEPYAIEYRLRRHDGVYRWVLGRAAPVRDDQGHIVRWYGTCTDIHEQYEREQFIRSILDSSSDCIKVIDLEGRLLSMNRSGLREMGATDFSNFAGKSYIEFWDAADRPRVAEAFIKAKRGENATFEASCIVADGTLKWWEVALSPMTGPDGRPERLLCISRDISGRKRSEQELRQASQEAMAARARAEEANSAKSEFLAHMSHEIRTPMNAVVGLAAILAQSEPLTAKQKEYLHTLRSAADSLLALISDLLDIAKIEARTVELESIAFNLHEALTEVGGMVALRAQEKGIAFHLVNECGQHYSVIGDPTRFKQIVANLCSNAVKFTERGAVTLHCRLTPDPRGVSVDISVRDTGIGIAPDRLEAIFEKFVQADSSITRKFGGTGLGLAITRMLAELMGGTVGVESALGKGSLFTVKIPFAESSPFHRDVPMSDSTAPSATGARPVVLLAEDYPANVLVATSFLDYFGYGYEVVASGVEAVKKAENQDFAAILMDVQMHGMNGFEATQAIRAHELKNGKRRIPIIGMTAHALLGDRERCLAAGMDDYISKPFNPDELKAKLSQCTMR